MTPSTNGTQRAPRPVLTDQDWVALTQAARVAIPRKLSTSAARLSVDLDDLISRTLETSLHYYRRQLPSSFDPSRSSPSTYVVVVARSHLSAVRRLSAKLPHIPSSPQLEALMGATDGGYARLEAWEEVVAIAVAAGLDAGALVVTDLEEVQDLSCLRAVLRQPDLLQRNEDP
jgi:hypothetical protein